MKKIISSLITATAIIPLFWFDVLPNGLQICNDSRPFATINDSASQLEAAKYAKAKLCNLIRSFPL